ncbi:MAG: hypothetical protein EZS28_026725 [Streblomastix strix]|uniref:Uncharacterized protein n=1 Tax=Streblomastix strix TaxID=222440 RepID=A0A5J4V584_9EUKA|nr:MAG: hypothetical protein EZS28_026725 [Streblomastix strix]
MFQYLLCDIVALANALLISLEVVEEARFSLYIRDNIIVKQALSDLAGATDLFYLSFPTSATGQEGRRPHYLEQDFDPRLSFSVPSPEFYLIIQGKRIQWINSLV